MSSHPEDDIESYVEDGARRRASIVLIEKSEVPQQFEYENFIDFVLSREPIFLLHNIFDSSFALCPHTFLNVSYFYQNLDMLHINKGSNVSSTLSFDLLFPGVEERLVLLSQTFHAQKHFAQKVWAQLVILDKEISGLYKLF